MYDKVKGENPESKMTDLTKIISHMWSEIDEDTKKKYDLLHEERKKIYEKEVKEYEE